MAFMKEEGEGEKGAFCYLISGKTEDLVNTVLQCIINTVVAIIFLFMNMESY